MFRPFAKFAPQTDNLHINSAICDHLVGILCEIYNLGTGIDAFRTGSKK
jgi:hypothetical protein